MSGPQIPATIPASGPPQQGFAGIAAEAPEHVPPSRLLGVLYRRRWLVLATMLVSLPPLIIMIERMPDYFDAQAQIMINTRKSTFHDLQATVEASDVDAVAIGTQVGIIRSVAMATRVVDRLGLTHLPAFGKLLDVPPSKTALLRRHVEGWFGIAVPAAAPESEDLRRQRAAQILGDKVSAANDGHSYMITIQARTADPVLSATIVNAYSDLYLNFNRELKISAIRRANSLLDEEIAPMRERLRKADEAVETYRQEHGLITGGGHGAAVQTGGAGTTVSEQQLAQINAQLIEAAGDLEEKEANLRQVQAARSNGSVDSLPGIVDSSLIATLRAQQTDISSRLASLSETASSGNPALKSATAASNDIQRRINAEVQKIIASTATKAAAAQTRVRMLRDSLDRLQGKVAGESRADVSLHQLESEASAARAVYQDYLGRFDFTSSAGALQEPEADLISPALVPLGRSGPPRTQLMALAAVFAAIAGAVLALVLDRLHRGIRTGEQLEATTGLAALGMVPIAPKGIVREYAKGADTLYTAAMGQITGVLRHGRDNFRARVVLVTSAAPGEGKTSFAISLAASAGREGSRALLVDCDLYQPAVASTLKIDGTSQQKLGNGTAISSVVLKRDVLPGVDVFGFEVASRQWNESALAALRDLILRARETYDLIVLDAPPVLAFADAPVMSLEADGAIMVVRWRHTPVAAVNAALRTLRSYRVRVLGGVVTQVNIKELDAAEGGHAHFYRTHASYFR